MWDEDEDDLDIKLLARCVRIRALARAAQTLDPCEVCRDGAREHVGTPPGTPDDALVSAVTCVPWRIAAGQRTR